MLLCMTDSGRLLMSMHSNKEDAVRRERPADLTSYIASSYPQQTLPGWDRICSLAQARLIRHAQRLALSAPDRYVSLGMALS